MTIEEFIRARLAEEEQAAVTASVEYEGESWTSAGDSVNAITASNIAAVAEQTYNEGVADHIARHDPARVLRQVAALREAVEQIRTIPTLRAELAAEFASVDLADEIRAAGPDLRAIAAIWSDHPDYRPEWRA